MSSPLLFLVGVCVSVIVLAFVVTVIQEIYNYKDLQERLKKERERKAEKEKHNND